VLSSPRINRPLQTSVQFVSPRGLPVRSFKSAAVPSPSRSPSSAVFTKSSFVNVGAGLLPKPPTEQSAFPSTPPPRSVTSHRSIAPTRLRTFQSSSDSTNTSKLLSQSKPAVIRVVVRTRPLSQPETVAGLVPAVTVGGPDAASIYVECEGQGGRQVTKSFAFPACIKPEASQQDVFETSGVTELLDSAMNGCDCCPCRGCNILAALLLIMHSCYLICGLGFTLLPAVGTAGLVGAWALGSGQESVQF
jgi:hypothetical protein